MVDNCYCEFVSTKEPIEVGADIVVGSLIKNLGGGIAPNGAYVVGKEKLINLYENKIINIHPSLIPSFCGSGYYGLRVHKKAFERGWLL